MRYKTKKGSRSLGANEIQSRNVLNNYPECKYVICGMGQDRRAVGWVGGEYETKRLMI